MYVGGERVPGFWLYVESSGDTWLAQDGDGAWRWGQGTEPNPDDPRLGSTTPVLSPGGAYLAALGTEDGDVVTLIDTTSGEWLGSLPVDLGDPSEPLSIQAVTDDGKVILQSTETSTLWLPLAGNGTVDLNETAPGQVILDNTPAGLVVMSGDESEKYLAEISEAGELSRTGDLPALDSLEVSPGGQWMAVLLERLERGRTEDDGRGRPRRRDPAGAAGMARGLCLLVPACPGRTTSTWSAR